VRSRSALALGLAAAYAAFLAYTTAGTQCPVRSMGPCARVHQLLARARQEPPPTIVPPLTSRPPAAPDAILALVATTAVGRR